MKTNALRFLIVGLALTGMAWAADDENDPGRGVARISLINGDVSVRRGDSGDLVAAAVNAPLVAQDQLVTGSGSRAELQFDWANVVRLSSNTEIHLADLENRRYVVELAQGTVTFSVLRDSDADVEISTPSVSVRPVRKGSYRITVRDNGDSEITVRSGQAEIFTPRGSETLRSGRTMVARGPAQDPEYQMISAIPEDSWDRWNRDRDRYFDRATADTYRYVDPSIYGAEDLYGYGSWVYVAPYGYCWRPIVTAGWAPYSYGRWAWVDWYGWTWVSYDPWGWAPFHYGRWFHQAGHGWCWYPGAFRTHHYWRPALVAFFGFGSGSIGVGFGRVGWIPLAPNEPFRPWYGRGFYHGYRNNTVINNVTIVNNTNIVNVYRNARVAQAVTVVDGREFGRGHVTRLRVGESDLRQVDLVRGQLPIAPNRESLRVSNRPAVAAPGAPANERFFTRTRPAVVERVPFEQQQRGMEQITRRTFGEPAAVRRVEPMTSPATGSAVPAPRVEALRPGQAGAAPPAAPGENGAGFRRIPESPQAGTPDRGAVRSVPERAPNAVQPPGANERWRRFQGTDPEARPVAPPTDRSAPRNFERPAPPSRDVPSYQPATPPRNVEERRSAPPEIRNVPAPNATEAPGGNGSRRGFQGAPDARPVAPPTDRSAPRNFERPAPAPARDVPSYQPPTSPRNVEERRSAPPEIRISPPIVRERVAPAREMRPMPSPRMESPRAEPPRPPAPQVREVPRSNGGGAGRGQAAGRESRGESRSRR